MAHSLLHRRNPTRQLGRDWINRFIDRHSDIKYVLVKTIATTQANAQSWDIMDDFFAKVSLIVTFFFFKLKK